MLCNSACARHYEYVYIPTKCDIKPRQAPMQSGDILQDLKAVLVYTELLKSDLDFCRGEE
ncbi:hypothetical protein [Helicobacter sp. 12S02634-8]|uniref:hypothetical protein n=1 Tax=Helicobacter sp. 12S02634-8 TaxID=1476199 RepID=UPI00209C29AC|nr:hypothetical protein [Helicobacter sp. 12S02634-8]